MTKNAKSAATRHRVGSLLRMAATLLALGAFAAPASAKPFQQYLNGACAGKLCRINFAKVPAGQRLTVSNISCYWRLANAQNGFAPQIRAAQMLVIGATANDVLNAVTLVPEQFARAGVESVYSADHSVFAFANADQRLQAYVELSIGKFSQVACHISGDMAKAT